MSRERLYRYSEMFGETFQGEGHHCGKNTVWLRWFGCNKTCCGFNNMKDGKVVIPEKEMYYNTIDPIDVKTIFDVPVQDMGCDSVYSWHPRFRYLAQKATAVEIARKLVDLNRNEYNPDGLFVHPNSGQDIHLCFTGGESMMSQQGIVEVLQHLRGIGNCPRYVTVETNGSVNIDFEVKGYIEHFLETGGKEFFWSVSPKLESVTGERWADSICPDVVREYVEASGTGQLKFVCDNTPESWAEITKAVNEFRAGGVSLPIWIMPEGASSKAQGRHHALIAEEAVRRGYYFASRVHATVFGACPGK